MKKRKVLAVMLVIFALSIGFNSPTWAKAKYTMKIATVWPTDLTATNKSLNYLKPRIEELTDGQVQVELRKGNLGGERDLFEGVQLGTIEAAVCTTGTLGGFVPLAEIFMVPYLFKNWNHSYAVLNGPFGKRLEELALPKGIRIIDWWSVGGREIYGNGGPIPTTPELLKGKKIRVMETPFLVELYKHYDALPVPMAFTEVYTALQQGVVDGVQAGFSTAASGHHEVSEWIVEVGENMTVMAFALSDRWWKKLPTDIQGQIQQAISELTTIQHIMDAQVELENKEQWKAQGVKVLMGDRKAFIKKASELYPKFAEMLGPEGKKWLEWIGKVGEGFPILEQPAMKEYSQKYNLSFTY